jgi:hypothetical protein
MSDPHGEKSEPDVDDDPKVAGSRASKDEGGKGSASGPYVGRASGDDDFDTEESGAEARSDDT